MNENNEEPDVEYWVEYCPSLNAYQVVSQVKGYPSTDAIGESFPKKKDADEICEMLKNKVNIFT